MLKPGELIRLFAAKHPVMYDNFKDVAYSLAVMAAIMLILYVYVGTWPRYRNSTATRYKSFRRLSSSANRRKILYTLYFVNMLNNYRE